MLDLRHWLDQVTALGQLRLAEGPDWDKEIGAIAEMVTRQENSAAVLFDCIKGYNAGQRILVNADGNHSRLALTCGFSPGSTARQFMDRWRAVTGNLEPVRPTLVNDGPVMENVLTGDDIDLLSFPVPRWHGGDGGRYLGTADSVITRDPDDGRVNLGTYRVMVAGRNHLVGWLIPGKDGYLHRKKYFDKGQNCPIVISFGHHPLIFLISSIAVPADVAELEYIGAIAGEPVEVIAGPFTGLPIPAASELAIEGEVLFDQAVEEGPFGEWTGYYASTPRPEPLIVVKAIYHRNNPIILGCPPSKPPSETSRSHGLIRSVSIEKALAQAGVPNVAGAFFHSPGGTRLLLAISIKQSYPGHARQAALAALGCKQGAFFGRYVILVDDDVDVTDLNDVMWAVSTRSDPARSIEIIRDCWSTDMDPALGPEGKRLSSRAIIDACWPYDWKDRAPKISAAEPELSREVHEKWGSQLLEAERTFDPGRA